MVEAAWQDRVGSLDRGDGVALATSPFFPRLDSGPRPPPSCWTRVGIENGIGNGAGLVRVAGYFGILVLLRATQLGVEAFDRTSPDCETRFRTYLRDLVRAEAGDDFEREQQIFRVLRETTETLEALRQWHIRHPDTVAHPEASIGPG
jgi:hypothetical protein